MRDALAALGPVVAEQPENAHIWCLMARRHLGLQEFAAAREALYRTTSADPGGEYPHRLLSLVYS